MTNKQNRSTFAYNALHFPDALPLEIYIANGKNLVDNEDLGLEMCCHGKCEPYIHAGGQMLDRGIKELFDLSEGNNLVKLLADFALSHTQYGAIQVNIFASG